MPPWRDPMERFDEKWKPEDRGYRTLCWIWTSSKNGAGYGVLRLSNPRRQVLAHRWILEQSLEIELGSAKALHRCDQSDCVNPDHIYAGTQKQNNEDTVNRGRHWTQTRTECPRCGTVLEGGPCMTCKRATWRKANQKYRAKKAQS